MPRVVDELPKRNGRRTSKYSELYDTVLDGQTWELVQGEDFDSEINTMRTGLSKAAANRGVKVATRVKGDSLFVEARSE